MKAICINTNGSHLLRIGKVYDVEDSGTSGKYYSIPVRGGFRYSYSKDLFQIIEDITLQPGTIRCACGALTTNKVCCCDCGRDI
jgi:hypothetical protein